MKINSESIHKRNNIWMYVTSVLFSFLLFHSISVIPVKAKSFPFGADPLLVEHSKVFKSKIYNVTNGVHVAVGYTLANMIIVDGKKQFQIFKHFINQITKQVLMDWSSLIPLKIKTPQLNFSGNLKK